MVTNSPVISDPATPSHHATTSFLSTGFPSPFPHLQLIPSLVPQHIYWSITACTSPDCLLHYAKLFSTYYLIPEASCLNFSLDSDSLPDTLDPDSVPDPCRLNLPPLIDLLVLILACLLE